MRFLPLLLIKFYKLAISPYMPGQCRYNPTCSVYAAEAINTHGAVAGSWLALKRIGRCHPGRSRGYDPVPGVRSPEVRPEDQNPKIQRLENPASGKTNASSSF